MLTLFFGDSRFFLGYPRIDLAEIRVVLLLFSHGFLQFPESSMPNVRSTDLAPAAEHSSPVSSAIDRVVAIAPAPLLPGEKQADYADVAVRIVRAAKPRDAIEDFGPRRCRSHLGNFSPSTRQGRNTEVLRREWRKTNFGRDRLPLEQKGQLSGAFAAGDVDERKKVDAILKKAGLSIDDVTAQTLDSKLDSFERLDRLLASAEARRNNALREIDRHRDALGGGVRRSIEEIEDAEFRDVETGEAAAGAKP